MADAHEAPGVDAGRPYDLLAVGAQELRDPAEGARAEALGAGLRGEEFFGEVLLGGYARRRGVGRKGSRGRREGEIQEDEEGEEEQKKGKTPKPKQQENSQ